MSREAQPLYGAGYKAPGGALNISPDTPAVYYYAGQSPRRQSLLEYALGTQVISIPGGSELDKPCVTDIAKGKMRHVLPQLPIPDRYEAVVFAADMQAGTLATSRSGQAFLRSKHKPKSVDEIRQTFHEMSETGAREGHNPYYQIVAGSGLKRLSAKPGRQETKIPSPHSNTIELDSEKTAFLSTDEGLRGYLDTFHNFYSTDSSIPANILDVNAGLDLPTLHRLGTVVAIDGMSPQDANYEEALRDSLYNALASFSPLLFTAFVQDVREKIATWPWLNQVMQFAAGGRETVLFPR